MKLTISKIFQLYHEQGQIPYGNEGVSQLDHALQCAALAEAANQSDEMVVACLLHDLGHLLHNYGVDATDRKIDDRHEYRAIPYLTLLFCPAVLEPIRLHVEAKRYCCAMEPSYWSQLSAGSKETLQLQGGIFSSEAAKAFIAQPYAREAVQLRRWDDQSKVVGLVTPDFAHFRCRMEACVL
jgi:phosphonate degradation associated HDIG domain protein